MAFVAPRTIIISSNPGKSTVIRNAVCQPQSTNVHMAETLLESGPRKRRRLTHLSPEERVMRRKLKNRVAAQTARDRKKERMVELEEALASLEAENKRLLNENQTLKHKTGNLAQENNILRDKLGLKEEITNQAVVSSSVGEHGFPGSAASKLPLQQERIRALYKATTHALALIVMLSLTSSLGCCKKSPKPVKVPRISSALRRKLMVLAKAASSVRNPALKWWGPHQQSWTPSKN